jgi:hypothetical protein
MRDEQQADDSPGAFRPAHGGSAVTANPGHEYRCDGGGRRAISVPLTPVRSGASRTLPGAPQPWSAATAQVETALCKQVLAPYKLVIKQP